MEKLQLSRVKAVFKSDILSVLTYSALCILITLTMSAIMHRHESHGSNTTAISAPYISMEARWFFKETPPSPILRWFNGQQLKFKEKDDWDRSDYYLTTGYEKMSLKIREGKGEIKVLDQSFGPQRLGNSWTGVVEKWMKWGPKFKNERAVPDDIFSDPGKFQEIKKERLLIKYEFDAQGKLQRTDPKRNDIKNGCQVELTKIGVNGSIVYSFAFESFGEEHLLMVNFKNTYDQVAKEIGAMDLSAENSYSYPVFLKKASTI